MCCMSRSAGNGVSRPNEDVDGVMARFQKRNQIVQVQRDVSLQSAVECSQPHARERRSALLRADSSKAGWLMPVVLIASFQSWPTLCNAGVVHEKGLGCLCWTMPSAAQGAEGDIALLTQGVRRLAPVSRTSRLGEECFTGRSSLRLHIRRHPVFGNKPGPCRRAAA